MFDLLGPQQFDRWVAQLVELTQRRLGDSATTMGNVNFTGPDGKITSVDKTWGFVKDDKGALRMVVHHSSLPFSGS